jgi:hypothetical protein
MNYQNSMQYIAQPALDLKFRQTLRRRKALDLPGGNQLWLSSSKAALVVLAIMFCLNLWLGFAVTKSNTSIQAIEANRHQLKNEEIILLAERAILMSEKQVRKQAGAKLALYVPGKEQVFKLR